MSRNTAPESSLELLLDTICNTFGGVIFLAILVVILVQMSSKTEPSTDESSSPSELARTEQQRADKQAKLERLRQAVKQQEELIERFADPETRQFLQELQDAQTNHDQLSSDRSEAWGDASKSQIDVNNASAALQKLDKDLQAARDAVASAKQALQRESELRARTGRYSMLRETKKLEMALFVRYGELFQMARRNASGGYDFNSAECDQRTVNNLTQVTPKQGQGRPIDGNSRKVVDGILANYDSNAHYLAVFIWPDSFGQFQGLKDAMVEAGFEYRLEPLPKDGQVTISAAPSAPIRVQ